MTKLERASILFVLAFGCVAAWMAIGIVIGLLVKSCGL